MKRSNVEWEGAMLPVRGHECSKSDVDFVSPRLYSFLVRQGSRWP